MSSSDQWSGENKELPDPWGEERGQAASAPSAGLGDAVREETLRESSEEDKLREEAIVECARRAANPPLVRPFGVMVLAMLLALYSVALFFGTLWSWTHLDEVRATLTVDNAPDVAWAVVIAIPFQMAFAAGLSYGLWNLQGWSRHSVLVFVALGLTRRSAIWAYPPFITTLLPGAGLSPAFLIHCGIFLGLAFYLRCPGIATAFSESRKFGD
jgi:hypothetical protein